MLAYVDVCSYSLIIPLRYIVLSTCDVVTMVLVGDTSLFIAFPHIVTIPSPIIRVTTIAGPLNALSTIKLLTGDKPTCVVESH
jgi:hypothetical protein